MSGLISGFNSRKDEPWCYYSYSSFTTPGTIYSYDPATGESAVYKQPQTAFDLSGLGKLADGRMEAEGLVRFSEVENGGPRDSALDAALLEAAKDRAFRVSVTLPPASAK